MWKVSKAGLCFRHTGWDKTATDYTYRHVLMQRLFMLQYLKMECRTDAFLQDLRFSRRWLWRMPSSGMWCHVVLVWTDVSEKRIASIFRVEKSASEKPGRAGGCRLSHQSKSHYDWQRYNIHLWTYRYSAKEWRGSASLQRLNKIRHMLGFVYIHR
jgi:hypothetical protein